MKKPPFPVAFYLSSYQYKFTRVGCRAARHKSITQNKTVVQFDEYSN